MSKIAVLCNDGVEEIECLTVVDFCRRAGIEVLTVSVTGKRQIMGAHQICFHADEVYNDMNFATVPTIQEEVIKRTKHPAFGYFEPREEYYSSIIEWQNRRNGVTGLEKEDIGYENGVLGCLASAVQAFTAPGEAVLLHSPTYIGFTRALEDNGRKIVLSPLVQDENGVWRMDYEDMDRKIKENNIHFCVFCSPHNPCGRVWERDEIEKAMEVYKNNQCRTGDSTDGTDYCSLIFRTFH